MYWENTVKFVIDEIAGLAPGALSITWAPLVPGAKIPESKFQMSYKSKRVKHSLIPKEARSALRDLRRVSKSAPVQQVLDIAQDALTVADKVSDPLVPDSKAPRSIPVPSLAGPKRKRLRRLQKATSRSRKARTSGSSSAVSHSSSSVSKLFRTSTARNLGPIVTIPEYPLHHAYSGDSVRYRSRNRIICNRCCPCIECK